MQQLLTGKTRLPGLSGEWEVKALGKIASANKRVVQLKTAARHMNMERFAHLNRWHCGPSRLTHATSNQNTPRDTNSHQREARATPAATVHLT